MTGTTPTPDTVDAATVLHWTRAPDDVTVIDVRTPAEFETAHIAGSYNVPLNLLGEHAREFAARLDRKVVLVCQSGTRASRAPASSSAAQDSWAPTPEGGHPTSCRPRSC